MAEAIDILDRLNAPGEIGSMLDLSMARIEKVLAGGARPAIDGRSLLSQLAREQNAVPADDSSGPNPWSTDHVC